MSFVNTDFPKGFMREYVGVTFTAKLAGVADTSGLPFQKAIKTGDSGAADIFNILIDEAMSQVTPGWQTRQAGFRFCPSQKPITHVWWADNLFLLASSITEWKQMFTEVSEALHSLLGARWKNKKDADLTFITVSIQDPPDTVAITLRHDTDAPTHTFTRQRSIKALGA